MVHIYVHIDSFLLHLTLNVALSLRNNQVHTFHWAFPSSPPTLFSDGCLLCISVCISKDCVWVGWGVLWYLVVLGALRVLSLNLPCVLGLESSSAVYLVFECFCWFAGIAFDAHHPSLLLHSCKWDTLVPICTTLILVLLYWGLADLVPGAQSL